MQVSIIPSGGFVCRCFVPAIVEMVGGLRVLSLNLANHVYIILTLVILLNIVFTIVHQPPSTIGTTAG
jgi:hypothetical protein